MNDPYTIFQTILDGAGAGHPDLGSLGADYVSTLSKISKCTNLCGAEPDKESETLQIIDLYCPVR